GGLFPVTFGHCGYAGLCVRGTTRAFCTGCEYPIRRPEYLYRVDYFLESYTSTAEAHERMGDIAGARERRRLATELQQLGHEMVLLAEAERNRVIPHWKALPLVMTADRSASPPSDDPFAHLKERAQERAQPTVERTRSAILMLQAREKKVSADSLKQASRE